jgi:phage shock protein C
MHLKKLLINKKDKMPQKKAVKRLTRSKTDKKIAGVAGGIANYFEIDPVLVRLIFALTCIPGGFPGLLAYIIAWIVMPLEK